MRKRETLSLAEPEPGVGCRTGTARNGRPRLEHFGSLRWQRKRKNHGSSVSRVPQPGLQRVCLSNAFVFGEQLSALLLWDAGKNRSIWTLSYLHVSTIPGQPVISRQRCCDIRGDFVAWGTVHKQLAPCAISFLLQNFHLLIYSCVGQKTTFRSWFSPASVSRGDRTQVLRFKFAAPTSPCHPLTLTATEQTARSIFFLSFIFCSSFSGKW